MSNINEKEQKRIKTRVITGIIAIVSVVVILVCILVLKPNNSDKMKKIGEKYYTEDLHQRLSLGTDDAEILKKYKDTGLQIPIEEILKIESYASSSEGKSLMNSKCDLNNSKVTIFPTEPFEANDYTLTVEAVCE